MPPFPFPPATTSRPTTRRSSTNLKKALGFVPNLFATFAHSPTALGTYLALQNAKSSLKPKEREVINLVVSQVNDCEYCLAAHTALGKMLGFTEAQILEIRRGRASFDPKLDGLARFVREVAEKRGHVLACDQPAARKASVAAADTSRSAVNNGSLGKIAS
jgi:AhpD family alkylhydroperoxidase